MHSTLLSYAALPPVSGDLCAAAAALLCARDYPHTTEHGAADESLYLARRFGLDWARRTTLAVVYPWAVGHPWLVAAYHELGAPTSEGHDA